MVSPDIRSETFALRLASANNGNGNKATFKVAFGSRGVVTSNRCFEILLPTFGLDPACSRFNVL